MLKCCFTLMALISTLSIFPQVKLTVEKIMQDPKWIGTSPSDPEWSEDGQTIYFRWNPQKATSDSLYFFTLKNHKPQKATPEQTRAINLTGVRMYNKARTAYTYTFNGDVFYHDKKTGLTKQITQTSDTESAPDFSFNETKIVFQKDRQLYSWTIASGTYTQLTNFRQGTAPPSGKSIKPNEQETWLERDQLEQFEVLKQRKENRDAQEAWTKSLPVMREPKAIYTEDQTILGLQISPDGRFISYSLFKAATGAKRTIIPSFVTESGFTTDINGRTKVGAPQGKSNFFIYDAVRDTVYAIRMDSIAGIHDLPDYVKDYPKLLEKAKEKTVNRDVDVSGIRWSTSGKCAILDIRAQDNKDRWLLSWDTSSRKLSIIDRQRDEAWIGGPGIGFFRSTGWIDENNFWFQSEVTGYSHLYIWNQSTKSKMVLTSGKYEVQQAILSLDKKYFYITTNEVHPGEKHYYRLTIADGKKERITTMTGANQVTISPDQKQLAILYSYANKPWELYIQENKPGSAATQITDIAQSEEFKKYSWRDPELISFKAADGAEVWARLYQPAHPHPSKPAVIFVHGAGYLQNAHKWWSSYFREYMFHNLLADNGYTVIDIDYRGSAGYGRDWRTGIYRHMGGKDLSDHVDAAKLLVSKYGVNPKNIGIYGGSYGGFITLMALFNEPGIFTSGAALRPVTDWANYNQGYTANILNEPAQDSLAYRRSSPYYFASGLKGNLLICHGMVDVNVHYQDAVKLAQRLIELGKDNWELASYPMEDHGFVEPSSWTDEYKRIYKLFERTLKSN
ncbi:S9 family peptidase [Pollutibacter soli]|uniref:S9 family peptidase n=1 Tax=Pollutibacter soli TaxID=3034157 RepID=UPI003013437F